MRIINHPPTKALLKNLKSGDVFSDPGLQRHTTLYMVVDKIAWSGVDNTDIQYSVDLASGIIHKWATDVSVIHHPNTTVDPTGGNSP